MLLYQGQVKWY